MNRSLLRAWKNTARLKHWVVAQITFALLRFARLLPARRAIELSATLGQFLGPISGRNQLVLDNLRLALPEKTEEEHKAIARGMWRNLFRLGAEYVFLEKLIDFDPDAPEKGMIEIKGAEIFERLRNEKASCIFFTGHTGNFELLPVCAAAYGLEVTALFRPPNNPYIAKRLLAARQTSMGHLVPSKAGAAWGLARALDQGKSVGMLVDQKYHKGVLGTFFGHPVRSNPLLAKLARNYDRPIYPARCIRLPKGRFRLELEEEIKLPRNAEGEIDIAASTQMLNDIIERWVREYPEQWLWAHRRWVVSEWRRPRPAANKKAGANAGPQSDK